MDLQEPLPNDIQSAIHAFLDQVDTVLLGRLVPRDQRCSIVGELESQIMTIIERKISSGSELNIELVRNIIETMDPPESYGGEFETPASAPQAAMPTFDVPTKKTTTPWSKYSIRDAIHRWMPKDRPRYDEVAIVGHLVGAFAFLFFLASFEGRSEFVLVMAMFFGLICSGLGFYSLQRIRRSNGVRVGTRGAFVNMIAFPLILSNMLLLAILFQSPLGIFLASLVMAAALLYANYWVVRFAWRSMTSNQTILGSTSIGFKSVDGQDTSLPVPM